MMQHSPIIVYLAISLFTAVLAKYWGKNPYIWFLLSTMFTPVLSFFSLLILHRNRYMCNHCLGVVDANVTRCRHCGGEISNDSLVEKSWSNSKFSYITAFLIMISIFPLTHLYTQIKYEDRISESTIRYNPNNYDKSYNIDTSNHKCSILSYDFKKNWESVYDKYDNPGPIYRSNCKRVGDFYYGYIYPRNSPSVRTYWIELKEEDVLGRKTDIYRP